MRDTDDYDKEVEAICAENQPILDSFQAWLQESGLSQKTVTSHIGNIAFFAEYLVYYDQIKRLDEANSGDVGMFLSDWFPRKALWASVNTVKSYLASFRKFFKWMGETDCVSSEIAAAVLIMLKEDRDEFLQAVGDDSPQTWWPLQRF